MWEMNHILFLPLSMYVLAFPLHSSIISYLFCSLCKVVDEGNGGIPLHNFSIVLGCSAFCPTLKKAFYGCLGDLTDCTHPELQ